jgi:hypothetical protein
MILVVGLITVYFVALLLLSWWMRAAIRRQQTHDLRFQLDILLHRIQTELSMQEVRLADRLRALK